RVCRALARPTASALDWRRSQGPEGRSLTPGGNTTHGGCAETGRSATAGTVSSRSAIVRREPISHLGGRPAPDGTRPGQLLPPTAAAVKRAVRPARVRGVAAGRLPGPPGLSGRQGHRSIKSV